MVEVSLRVKSKCLVTQIEEKDLMNNYSIVFHVMSSSEEISPKIKARKRSMEKMEKIKIEDKSDDKKIE